MKRDRENMKQSLQHKQAQVQKQKLLLTQQLQQSIQLLNDSTEELVHFIEQKSLENPFLEYNRDYKEQFLVNNLKSYTEKEDFDWLAQISDQRTSLYDSLREQIHLNYRKSAIRNAMIHLLDFIDENGYLTIDLKQEYPRHEEYLLYLDALTLLQQLEPAGIGARDLQECLLLQIERDPYSPPLAYIILEENFLDFVHRNWNDLAKKYDCKLSDIQQIFDYVLTLTPNPGAIFQEVKEILLIPELSLSKDHEGLHLTLNFGNMPQINFTNDYYQAMFNQSTKEEKSFMIEKKNEVEWLQRSLAQRNETILSVGQQIVEAQIDFFLQSDHPLRALSLKEVAEKLGIHESTVSRAVNGKYIETWFGIFELRSFFVQKFSADNEAELTAQKIQQELRVLINDEDKRKPLSDQKLSDLLKEKGYEVSRRTVAKYRKELGIPATTKRKRFDDL